PAAGAASPLFLDDVLQHLLLEQEFGHQPLQPRDLHLQVAGPTDRFGAGLLEARPPPAQGHLADAELAGAISPTQPLGPVRLRLLQQRANVLRVQPPTHTSLRNNSANAHYPWTSSWGADHAPHLE